jgi:DNA-binding NtrC family response regulator
MVARHKILVIDDEKLQRDLLAGALEKAGYRVETASSGHDAVAMVRSEGYDVALLDLRMPEMDGIEALRQIRQINPETMVIVMTAYGTVETAVEAMKLGAADYLGKPLDLDEVRLVIKRALEKKMLVAENLYLRQELERTHRFTSVVSESPAMQEVLSLVARVADSKATVLIVGESGTGKEVIARTIHDAGPTKDGRFVAVNCAALPETLLESELFGHEKGAFTGADRRKRGRFEVADGGTLFLDEIGDMPLGTQVKLLRVLQEHTIERLGSSEPIEVDVRIIAATHQDLKARIAEERFREDLFYRLNVVTIDVPPLRERREDILPLAELFLQKYGEGSGRGVEAISREACHLLIRYDWPGNIRELENAIERAVVLSRTGLVGVEDLPIQLVECVQEPSSEPGDLTLESLERQHIESVLKQTGGNLSLAADLLGIHRNTLRLKMRRHGIEKPHSD